MSPKTASKFTFDTEFQSEGDLVSNAARARQRRSFTGEEIDQLCARARAEGAKAGQVRAAEELARNFDELARSVRTALDQSRDEAEAMRAEAVAIAFALARKIAPAALAALPAGDVEAALREAMHLAVGEPRLMLRGDPGVIEILKERAAEIAAEEGYEGRVMLVPDAAIKGADCRIEWRGGGAERSIALIEAALDALIDKRFATQFSSAKG